jgi:CubicO group peptidase (beta-lactamase class C family)
VITINPPQVSSTLPPSVRSAEVDLDRDAAAILNRHPSVGFALAMVSAANVQFRTYGFADLASMTPVTAQTVFRIGSITKTFTAIAVMQLSERGQIDLDACADRSLRAYRLLPADGTLSVPTIRQLLTHTAGIPDVRHISDLFHAHAGPWDARPPLASAAHGQALPSLAHYYAPGLSVVVPPGHYFAYSNHGFATLGQIVEDVTGLPLDRYLRERIFMLAGMGSTDLVRTEAIADRLATGYAMRAMGPAPVPDRDWIGAGAGGAYSTLADLARYAKLLIDGGVGEEGVVVSPSTLSEMFERQFQTDARLPAMGLGFFRSDVGGHRVASHDGILPGFNSHLSVAPDAGVALVAVTNGSSGAMRWLPAEMDRLMRRLLDVPADGVRGDIAHQPAIWRELLGRYVLPPRIADLRGRLLLGGGIEIFVAGGRPRMRVRLPMPSAWRGVPMHPDDSGDPLVFRVDLGAFGLGQVRLCFRRDPRRGLMWMHSDLGGQPISFERVTRRSSRVPAAVVTGALLAGGVVAARRGARARRGDGMR